MMEEEDGVVSAEHYEAAMKGEKGEGHSADHLLGSIENEMNNLGIDADEHGIDLGTDDDEEVPMDDEEDVPMDDDEEVRMSEYEHAANAMGLGGVGAALKHGLNNQAMEGLDLDGSTASLEAQMEASQKALDEFQDYEWEDDMDIDMENDPWDDDAVMDEGEDEGLDGCKFGEMMNDETGLCEPIEGGYTDDEFNFDEGFSGDEFIDEELDQMDDEDEDISLSDIQEDFEESVGVNPEHIKMAIGAMLTIFMCIACPIIYMMRR